MTPDEVLSAFFGFGLTQWDDDDDLNLIPEPYRWIAQNPDSWYTPRVTQPPPKTQKIVLYQGEAGTGKTTQLNFDVARIQAQDPTALIIRLDFSHAILISSPLSTFTARFWDLVAGQVEPLIEKRGLRTAYFAARHRMFMRRHGGADIDHLRERYGYHAERDFSKMDEVELAGANEIRDAIRAYEKSSSDGSLGLTATQHIPGHRTVLCIDNVDHLGMAKVEIAMNLLTGVIEGDTEAFIAVRPEHSHLLKTFRQTRQVSPFTLHIEQDLVFRIASTRCRGAIQFARENGISAAQIEAYARRMTDLCAAIQADEHSVTLLNEWHNGDLRQMLMFLSQTSWSAFNRERVSSVRSVIYRNLIRSSMPQSLMEVFDPTPHPCKGSPHPFAFPRLRVLAYLAHHLAREKAVPVSRVKADFEDFFGLRPRVIEDALRDLSVEPLTSGALLRLTDEGDEELVVFLPAGAVFMSHVVFSCDFLSWLYDQSTSDSLPAVSAEQTSYQQVKLDKAANVLAHKLLRVFEFEHPYMRLGRPASPADVRRLRNYESMFGYRPKAWFLDRMSRQLQEYADKRTLDEAVLKSAKFRVRDATDRLDRAFLHSDQ